MLHAHSFILAAQVGSQPFADSVVLSFEDRRRRRGAITTLGGLSVLVDLPEAPALGHGDAYRLEDGRLVEIVAEAEELLEVRGRDPLHTVRLAWHLGNRHLETEIAARWLRIRRDHVIADMLRGLGARVVEIEGPFQPEGGAYAHGGHDHGGHGHGGHEHARHEHGDHGHEPHDHDHAGHRHGHAGHEHHDHGHHGHAHAHDHHDHHHGHEHGHDHAHEPKPAPRHAASDPAVTGPEEPRHDTSGDVPQFR